MANGKAGDHPLTDIVDYKANLYSPVAAALVREIAALADDKTRRELADLLLGEFNPNKRPDVGALERYLVVLRDRLLKDAAARGLNWVKSLGQGSPPLTRLDQGAGRH